jgi:hypothetical protein
VENIGGRYGNLKLMAGPTSAECRSVTESLLRAAWGPSSPSLRVPPSRAGSRGQAHPPLRADRSASAIPCSPDLGRASAHPGAALRRRLEGRWKSPLGRRGPGKRIGSPPEGAQEPILAIRRDRHRCDRCSPTQLRTDHVIGRKCSASHAPMAGKYRAVSQNDRA